MRCKALPVLLLLLVAGGCSDSGPKADLPYISEARSLAAEWALVNEQAGRGHLTRPYVRTMHASLRKQLLTAANSLGEPDSPYGQQIFALLRQPDDAAPQQLRARATALKAIEDSLESD